MNEVIAHQKVLLEREYGSNIAKIASYIKTIPSKEERTASTKKLIKLIEKLNPSVRYAENTEKLLWQHIYILSDCDLDVDHEFEKPVIPEAFPKVKRIPYSKNRPKASYYGKNIDLLIEKLSEIKDSDDSDEASLALGKVLKTFYKNWNSEDVKESVIKRDISKLSDGKLTVKKDVDDNGEMIFDSKYNNFNRKKRTPSANNRNTNNRRNTNNSNNRRNTNR